MLQAWNYLGAASEFAGRGTQAVTAYRRALGLLEEQGSSLERGEVWAEAVRVARVNLGRALVLKEEAGEAVSCLGAGDLTEVPSIRQPEETPSSQLASELLLGGFMVCTFSSDKWRVHVLVNRSETRRSNTRFASFLSHFVLPCLSVCARCPSLVYDASRLDFARCPTTSHQPWSLERLW